MKLTGILILALGLLLGGYALTIDVGVEVPARDFGYGVETPAMRVANLDLMTQRQNYLIFSGILAVVGAILTGFASMKQSNPVYPRQPTGKPADRVSAQPSVPAEAPVAVSICPKCRSMGTSDLASCTRCGAQLEPTT